MILMKQHGTSVSALDEADQASGLISKRVRDLIALVCSLLVAGGDPTVLAQTSPAASSSANGEVSMNSARATGFTGRANCSLP